MSSRQNEIGFYKAMSVKQRAIYLLDNYKHRRYFDTRRRKEIEEMIADIRAYERNRNDELGVRILSGMGMSDITSAAAEESIKIKNAFEAGTITESLIHDADDREMVKIAIDEWLVIKDDYVSLERAMYKLKPEDHELLLDYLEKKKDYNDIATEFMIEKASARKKIQRLRCEVRYIVSPDIKRHGLRWLDLVG